MRAPSWALGYELAPGAASPWSAEAHGGSLVWHQIAVSDTTSAGLPVPGHGGGHSDGGRRNDDGCEEEPVTRISALRQTCHEKRGTDVARLQAYTISHPPMAKVQRSVRRFTDSSKPQRMAAIAQ